MKDVVLTGSVEFLNEDCKEYSGKFEARLTESGAFDYGNKTAVVIRRWVGDRELTPTLIDTRYEIGITKDFKGWVKEYFANNYQKHTLKFSK